ncbi:MAG TPA: sigma-54 dependent transcriptional regulator [Blastocatellia bacterium]|nr:sigma-54 dependent transcriptional regulator [Blastocatellia bacterium]
MVKQSVLIVDDEESARRGLCELVQGWGYDPRMAGDGAEALELINDSPPMVVITDVIMPRLDGFQLLNRIKEDHPYTAVIMLTGQGSIDAAIRSVKEEGAFYYFEKPIDTRRLQLVLRKAVEYSKARHENVLLRRQLHQYGAFGDMVGASPSMREIYTLIEQVAPSSASVIITGESGTGKEMVARTIHKLSPRADQPFIAINCAAVPETLMESELFGHEKGAFTGASERRLGCFEIADKGTLLLDEIAEMAFVLQAKLLRVLEDKTVRRLGSTKEINVDVRVVAATNKEPTKAVQTGALREDLLYRLNVITIKIPPLREHRDDIPLLAQHMVNELTRRHNRTARLISEEAMELLMAYHWPGNVRELRNCIERAVVICDGEMIEKRHLAPHITGREPSTSADALMIPIGIPLDEVERRVILTTLARSDYNKTRAAEVLQISLKTLHNKLKAYRQAGEQLDQS